MSNLNTQPLSIPQPRYDRKAEKQWIVHIGVGGFHRAHQAFYLDELLSRGTSDWALCGMGILRSDEKLYNALRTQDYLYTLMVKYADGTIKPRLIGSIMDYIFVPGNLSQALEKLADPQTKIVSLTITEGGYNFDQNGNFIFDNPDVKWDLAHPESPRTVFGLLTAALRQRKARNIPPFTLLSCDNVQHNGDVIRKMMISFTEAVDPDLARWMAAQVSFPNCMVDRITPVITPGDVELLQAKFGVEDRCPVTCEPFIQWVLEDNFCDGRPAWEQVGAQFVQDIEPYEKVKLRLLNAGHSLLGFLGSLSGYQTIDQTVGDPLIRQALREFMNEEVTPTLGSVVGIDLESYKETLVERFGNPNIKDQLARICSDSSAKLPKFLIPTLCEQLKNGGQITYCVTVIAAWCYTLELLAKGQYDYPIKDALLAELMQAAAATAKRDTPDFLKLAFVFGDLHENQRFAYEFMTCLHAIRTQGVAKILRTITSPEGR